MISWRKEIFCMSEVLYTPDKNGWRLRAMHTYAPKLRDVEDVRNLSKVLFSLSCRFLRIDFALVEMWYLIQDTLRRKLKI